SPISSELHSAHTISTGRRRVQSSHTPANSATTTTGANRSALSTPTWNTVALSASTATRGIVNMVICVPTRDTVCPTKSLTKFRSVRTPLARSDELESDLVVLMLDYLTNYRPLDNLSKILRRWRAEAPRPTSVRRVSAGSLECLQSDPTLSRSRKFTSACVGR